jgi:oligopeptide/dipeptide ABC transporter ATP-binding protein
MVDNVIVMYAGQVVEQGTANEVLINPKAPYTMGLLESIPTVEKRGGRLSVISGTVPNPFNMPPACRFAPRCPYAWDHCRTVAPELVQARGSNQRARCHLHTPAGDSRLSAALERHEAAMRLGQGPSNQ